MKFEWDSRKAAVNRQKHAVSFEEALTIFGDARALDYLGLSSKARLLMVVHTERDGDTIRIISARRATKREADAYVKGWS
jgi:hypothetical protein